MQEMDFEADSELRRRRQRVNSMKRIVGVLAGLCVLSMALIIVLFVLLILTRERLDTVVKNEVAVMKEVEQMRLEQAELMKKTQSGSVQLYSSKLDYEPAVPVASGISEQENVAIEADRHKVYLTFEDGPSDKTIEILDVLKEKNVKATFFVTAKKDSGASEIYKRIVEEGHTLGMHSYSNKYSEIYDSEDFFEEDIKNLKIFLTGATGVEPVYYRFPGGSSNQVTNVPMENLIHYLNQEGMIYYDWNVVAGDVTEGAYSSDEIVAQVTGNVVKYKTAVVLLHDGADSAMTGETLALLIDALTEMDAEILPIDKDTSVIQFVKADDIK